MFRRSIILAGLFGVVAIGSTLCDGSVTPTPSSVEINKYLIVGFKSQEFGDAVNLQNGEFGANREVLSTGGTSPTGASFPTIQSVFDQRWEPSGTEAYLVHPIFGTHIAPWEGISYSGNIALTSVTRRISVSDTDLFADLGAFDSALDDIGIVAANPTNPVYGLNDDPVQSISNADYFNSGASELSPLGQLPSDSGGTNGVGFMKGVDLTDLTAELEEWKDFIEGAEKEGTTTQDNTITQDIVGRNYKDGSGPFLIELLNEGEDANPAYDLSFTDEDGDGFVIIDVNRGENDWELNNSDIIIDGPEELTAIFRINGESNMNVSNTSIQIGEGGIAEDGFGAIFFKGDSEGEGSGDAVFSGNNVVFTGLAFWELNEGTSDLGKNEINIQNGQGCAQFIGSTVLHTSNSRFNKCTFSPPSPPPSAIPEPASFAVWALLAAVMGLASLRRSLGRRSR